METCPRDLNPTLRTIGSTTEEIWVGGVFFPAKEHSNELSSANSKSGKHYCINVGKFHSIPLLPFQTPALRSPKLTALGVTGNQLLQTRLAWKSQRFACLFILSAAIKGICRRHLACIPFFIALFFSLDDQFEFSVYLEISSLAGVGVCEDLFPF